MHCRQHSKASASLTEFPFCHAALAGLSALQQLTHLDLSYNYDFGDAGAEAVAAALPRLRSLHLGMCRGLGPRGLAALHAMHSLTDLNLNRWVDRGSQCVDEKG